MGAQKRRPIARNPPFLALRASDNSTTLRRVLGVGNPLRHMHIHLSDPSLVDDLLAFLRTRQCVALTDPAGRITVSIPESPRKDAARLELDLYLQVWRVTHPGVDVLLAPDGTV